jgi:hypothetical protein
MAPMKEILLPWAIAIFIALVICVVVYVIFRRRQKEELLEIRVDDEPNELTVGELAENLYLRVKHGPTHIKATTKTSIPHLYEIGKRLIRERESEFPDWVKLYLYYLKTAADDETKSGEEYGTKSGRYKNHLRLLSRMVRELNSPWQKYLGLPPEGE